jgi:4-hydroxy-tetrahydrodipicolinate synthase
MTPDRPIEGLWLPLITPFRDGRLDEASLRRLARHYAGTPIDGLVLAATTGEALTLTEDESERLVEVVAGEIAGGLPIILGRDGSDTSRLAAALERSAGWPISGYLIACPSYSRPSQDGLFRHFSALASETAKPILVYNIPYRTGVNLRNETLLRLAEVPNIVGVKDCCADVQQSFDLLRLRPEGFCVLTGEDALFYDALTHGADGGILAAAHVETERFARLRNNLLARDWRAALREWCELVELARLLFVEPNPAPLKHWLWRSGLIDSPELRLPMTGVSASLAGRLDSALARGAGPIVTIGCSA